MDVTDFVNCCFVTDFVTYCFVTDFVNYCFVNYCFALGEKLG